MAKLSQSGDGFLAVRLEKVRQGKDLGSLGVLLGSNLPGIPRNAFFIIFGLCYFWHRCMALDS